MKTRAIRAGLLSLALTFIAVLGAESSTPTRFRESDLEAAFQGAEEVDLATSKVSSVVTLREVVGIEPPVTSVPVKTFEREALPSVLKQAFAKPSIRGVTINGKYIAIIRTKYPKEYQDILRHELVHAYITMASPERLPFWFQEASAVHFSTDKTRKFYGQPSETQVGVMEGHVVDLTPTYKQKLQSFHFLIDSVGKEKFYEWYKQAVETGNTDARPLLGLTPESEAESGFKKPFPIWLGVVMGVVVLVVAVIGYISSKHGGDYV